MSNPDKDWAAWAQLMGADMPKLEMDVDGWAKCRIGNRDGRNGELVNWVFGIAKGDFGIWISGYPITYHPIGGYEFADGMPPIRPLAALTHIRTGLGMGLFFDVPWAIEAANIIQSAIDWRATPLTDNTAQDASYWATTLNKVHRSWEFRGLDHHPHLHAHAFPGGPPHGVWSKFADAGAQGKPEKLS